MWSRSAKSPKICALWSIMRLFRNINRWAIGFVRFVQTKVLCENEFDLFVFTSVILVFSFILFFVGWMHHFEKFRGNVTANSLTPTDEDPRHGDLRNSFCHLWWGQGTQFLTEWLYSWLRSWLTANLRCSTRVIAIQDAAHWGYRRINWPLCIILSSSNRISVSRAKKNDIYICDTLSDHTPHCYHRLRMTNVTFPHFH